MKLKDLLFRLGTIACSFAFIMALSSLDTMCVGTFHQPKLPESLINR